MAVGISIFLSKCEKTEAIYRTTTDTVFDTVYHNTFDTIAVEFPVLVDDGVIDTLYLTKAEVLKDTDSVYEIVEDDTELQAVLKVFEELLEDVDIEM